MTPEDALAEVGKVNERLKMLDEQLQHAMSDPGSWAVPRLQQEISESLARKRWLLEQIEPMQRAGALNNSLAPKRRPASGTGRRG
jgi:hypothetical protein